MAGVNKAIILGNLGADPELRDTGSGRKVANFNIATTEKWRDKESGDLKEQTQWHRVVAWGQLGENAAKFLSKGRQAYVEGRLQTRDWEDKDGVKRYTTEVIAQNIQFLGSPKQNGEPTPPPAGGSAFDDSAADAEVPF